MADVIILGNGPAGISASAYTARAKLSTMVIGRDQGALKKVDKIENYYGFSEPISGDELVRNGIAQAKRLGAEIIQDEIVGLSYDGEFILQSKTNEYRGKTLILATGASRKAPKIQGLREFEGKGVSYCAICDAFFYRKKAVAVFGDGEYALHEAMELLPIVGSVALLTNGKEPTVEFPKEITVYKNEIASFDGDPSLRSVSFKDGTALPISGVFIAVGVAGSADFARKLGAEIDGTNIVVNDNMETSVPGLYAAGDCTGGLLQIVKAACDGAKASMSAIKRIRSI